MPALNRDTMHIAIDQSFQSLSGNQYRKFLPEAKDLIINKVIDEFIIDAINEVTPEREKDFPLGFTSIRVALEKYNRLSTLIKHEELTVAKATNTDYYSGDLPATLYWFESSMSRVKSLTCNKSVDVPNQLPNINDTFNLLEHYYAGTRRYPVSEIVESKLRIHTGNRYTIEKCEIIYIKKPAIVATNINCDLPSIYHQEIVDRAVKFISASSTNPNFQYLLTNEKAK